MKVKVQGEAKGTSLVCPDQDLLSDTLLHWGSHYTTEVMVKEIKIENHGADPQTLTWYQQLPKGFVGNYLTECINNKQTIQPGEYCVFAFRAKSAKPTKLLEEQWMLRTNIQGKSTDTAFLVKF